jgi:hypothetical protein
MLIANLTLTPGLARTIRQVVGAHVEARQVACDVWVLLDASTIQERGGECELTADERIRLRGVIAAHKKEAF